MTKTYQHPQTQRMCFVYEGFELLYCPQPAADGKVVRHVQPKAREVCMLHHVQKLPIHHRTRDTVMLLKTNTKPPVQTDRGR